MPTTQLRTEPLTSGSNNDRLEDFLIALNSVLGLSGDEWNNSTEGVAGRWNQGTAFTDKLAAATGGSLRDILYAIDAIEDNSITQGDPGAATGNRTISFGNFNLNLGSLADYTVTGTTGSVFTHYTPDFSIRNPVSGTPAELTLWDNDDSHGVTFKAAGTTTVNYDVIMPTTGPQSNGQIMVHNTDGTTSFTDLTQTGKYRGILTLAGGSNNLPTINDGTVALGQAFAVGDFWLIAANGTLDDGVGTKAVLEGQRLYLDDVTADEVGDFTVFGSASYTDTNLFSGPQVNQYGNLSHDGGTYDFELTNVGNFDVQADAFGSSVDAGSALAIDSQKVVYFGGYANAAGDGTPNRTLGVTATGEMVSFDLPKTEYSAAWVQLGSVLTAGTPINFTDPGSEGHTLVNSVGSFTLANHQTQAAMMADPELKIWFDNSVADKTGLPTSALGVVRVSNSQVSFTQDLPEDTILHFELLT